MRIFSLISLLVVVGFIAWFSVQSLTRIQSNSTVQNESVVHPTESGGRILAPIEDAQNAKDLIELRSREAVQGEGG